jgi:hypothetical protein
LRAEPEKSVKEITAFVGKLFERAQQKLKEINMLEGKRGKR